MPFRPRLLLGLVVVLLFAAALPSSAGAQVGPAPTSLVPASPNEPPPRFALSSNEARRIAERQPEIRALRSEHRGLGTEVKIPLYVRGQVYSVTYFNRAGKIFADVHVDGVTGEVLDTWTGPQADMLLARGTEPSMGRLLDEPYVWFPLAALFLLPFVDLRRPFRVLHLDLLVLLGFGLSQMWFNQGNLELSVPAVYPLLAYLLVRMVCSGFRPRERGDPLIPYARVSWLAVGLVVLVAFRIVLNLADSHVIDVGYASVIGADRITQGEELYVLNDMNGDTYGPINYVAYVPFELIFPWLGTPQYVGAAHAAAITFDLLVIIGLMLLGTRLRPGAAGRKLGLALAYAWAAYPFTLYALQANTNDALVSLLVIGAVLLVRRPLASGATLGLAAAAKFAPLALAPLLATGLGDRRRVAAWPAFAAGLVAVCALSVTLYLPDGGIREFYDATLGYQLSRESPFSPWGLDPSLAWMQEVLKAGAVLLGAALAFLPGRRSLRQVCALGAAVMIAVQLPAIHWFYFYIVWFAPLVLAAVLSGYATSERRRTGALDGWSRSKTASR